ncbi:hypothetical protein Pryu01_01242 [Paraliobacillus ryukyuensis]|uniref:YjcQ protein n=1 Tax=Paraliobacillus ryukyuensis TaxID=200904 RepID=A0A366EDF1_9BACI|nr:YjcQ family protein [Paraliobacillus ryukyuensis]RBO99524.1 YjcQ protein [Paraliobacillus ryukyuensis]
MKKVVLSKMLKELDENNDIKMSNYDLDKEKFGSYVEILRDEKLAENITVQRGGQENKVLVLLTRGGRVTLKGYEFIENNPFDHKAPNNIDRRKLRYSILKELDKGNDISKELYGLDSETFIFFVNELKEDGYITNVTIDFSGSFVGSPRLTPEGEKYVDEHSKMKTVYGLVKELRDWVKL